MKERRILFSPEAADDLVGLYDWITQEASPIVAMAYIERVEAFCQRFGIASERCQLRNDIRPGLRVIGFERRLTIAFIVGGDAVTILRVFGAGRNWETVL